MSSPKCAKPISADMLTIEQPYVRRPKAEAVLIYPILATSSNLKRAIDSDGHKSIIYLVDRRSHKYHSHHLRLWGLLALRNITCNEILPFAALSSLLLVDHLTTSHDGRAENSKTTESLDCRHHGRACRTSLPTQYSVLDIRALRARDWDGRPAC